MEDQSGTYARTWRSLRNSLERLTQVKENLHINVNQCLYMQSEILKLLQVLQQDQSPAAQEFYGIAMRALKLVEECSTERWLLKAVEIGDCPEHFVELYLDLRWSSNLAGQEIGCDQISISDVHKVRDEDKLSLMFKVKEVLEGENKNHKRCQVEQQLATILRDRSGCSDPSSPQSPPYDLKRYVRGFRFNLISGTFFQRVQGGSSFVVKYHWVYKKEFVLKLALKSSDRDIIKKEAEIMEKCRHPYVVGVVGCWEVKSSKSFMVMECMECTLTDLMRRRRTSTTKQGFSASEAIDLLLPVAKALRYMHGKVKPIAHRDIKPDNIMCSREPEVGTKLIDFGDSVEFDPSYFSRTPGVALTTKEYGVTGTAGYMAPEVRDCRNFEYIDSLKAFPYCDLLKADVFSFGMVLGELLTWKTPEESLCAQAQRSLPRSEMNDLLKRGWRPHIPHDVPAYVAFVVESCWRKFPTTRPSFEDICLMLQNAQHLLGLNVKVANEATSSLVSYTDSDATDWPIPGKFTVREMLNLE
ncbi:hypothetical protein KC19_6G024700 [Ceratodon purpureus]|uniref:Protein kinase domain-containing protein n=1 Tax=Ceratodon purpureus TaxID=3225 RepID=A0A8T0HB60_CERPU|nr:hypothetical protein KC19_6G024700 [Ceratodon purpureus]